jgi:non-heme chloroperoxidase
VLLAEPGLLSWLVAVPGGEELFARMVDTMKPARQAVVNGDLEGAVRLFMTAVQGRDMFDQLPTEIKNRLRENARLIGAEPTDVSEVTDITREETAAIQAPTLLLTGDQSPEMFLLVSQELAHLLPKPEQAQIDRASHVLHYMNAEAFNETVLRFLAEHPG